MSNGDGYTDGNDDIDSLINRARGNGGTGGGAATAVGAELYDLDGNYAGKLVSAPGIFPKYNLAISNPARSPSLQAFKGGSYLVDAGAGKVFNLMIDPQGAVVKSVTTTLGDGTGGGGGGTAPAWSSTQAAWQAQSAWEAQQADIQRKWQAQQARFAAEEAAEQNRLAEEAAMKRQRLGTLTDLVEAFLAKQAGAMQTLADLDNPYRFAAVAGGVAPYGVTPHQGYAKQLRQFATAPAPTIDPNASPASVESAIKQLTGVKVPLAPTTFGMV